MARWNHDSCGRASIFSEVFCRLLWHRCDLLDWHNRMQLRSEAVDPECIRLFSCSLGGPSTVGCWRTATHDSHGLRDLGSVRVADCHRRSQISLGVQANGCTNFKLIRRSYNESRVLPRQGPTMLLPGQHPSPSVPGSYHWKSPRCGCPRYPQKVQRPRG